MTQEQVIKKFKAYQAEVEKNVQSNAGVGAHVAATLLLAEVVSNIKIGIHKQAWEELADELSSL